MGSLLLIAVILISLTVHEYSHGRVAYMLGDDTAKNQGRLTLNPLKHLDPIGTLFFYFMHFGWAKPVPVDPRNLKDPHRDMLFIAAAGPASNLVLALLAGFFLRFMGPLAQMEPMTFYIFGFNTTLPKIVKLTLFLLRTLWGDLLRIPGFNQFP
jgi:Zn-dependent protease